MGDTPKEVEVAEKMYVAYGDDATWFSHAGARMPTWGELPSDIQRHWLAAAQAAKKEYA